MTDSGVCDEAYLLACDYIYTKLHKDGYDWSECPELPEPSRLRLAMRSLGDEFEREYKRAFDNMCDALHLTLSSAYPTFFGVADELFKKGVTWGRIVALYAFGGALSEYCVRKSMPQLVTYVADWVGLYAETRLSNWIDSNGGWDGFLAFYEKRPLPATWPSFKRTMTGVGVVFGGLGVVALGAMLAMRG
uniref:Bcl-2 Bcl-2 homology region 1-3 domain-containing protein n=1 Tax=Romanomermis culicivorax TaxID=13658 RepID=A0A915KVV2_ROMCU